MPWVPPAPVAWAGGPGGPWGKGGWGKGGGWNKGGGGGRSRPSRPPLPPDFTVDPTRVYIGTVTTYYKFQGYGFIQPDEEGVIPNDKVFILWKNIVSSDRYPSLSKDMKVQFTVQIVEKNGERDLQAMSVANLDGSPIMVQDEVDSKKSFVGGQTLRYTGTLKFFIPKQGYGYGYIKIDPGYQYDREDVPQEIRVETTEMNCGGGNPQYFEDLPVEFGIWVTTRGIFKAYNVTARGGMPLPSSESAAAQETAGAAAAPPEVSA